MKALFATLSVTTLLVYSCHTREGDKTAAPAKDSATAPTAARSSLIRPLPGVEVPFKDYAVKAEKGDTIFYPSGSILVFPPDAFVDKAGIPVQGNVTVRYREFSSPMDIYLSGIPMDYDSAGKKYSFVTAGMYELQAYKDSVPVYANPKSNPWIYLTTKKDTGSYGLYQLDTLTGKWQYEQTQTLAIRPGKSGVKSPAVTPAIPKKADPKLPLITVSVDASSFGELSQYDNLHFQLLPGEQFSAQDTAQEWNDIQLHKAKKAGEYLITFANSLKTVSYKVTPVLQGQDYERQLKGAPRSSKSDSTVAKLDQLIKAGLKRRRDRGEANDIAIAPAYRAIMVKRIGIGNCDYPFRNLVQEIFADFKDKQGNTLTLTQVMVLMHPNNLMRFFPNNKIQLPIDRGYMIAGINEGRFCYINYFGCQYLVATEDTKVLTFPMTIVPIENNNYEYLSKLQEKF